MGFYCVLYILFLLLSILHSVSMTVSAMSVCCVCVCCICACTCVSVHVCPYIIWYIYYWLIALKIFCFIIYLIDLNVLNLMVCLSLHINCNYIIIFIGYFLQFYGKNHNKWTLELISSFSRPGLVKFNKIYIEKVN